MTREEAILCLKGIKNIGRDMLTEQKDFQECLDMAIKALEQEPTAKENLAVGDCISRAELLKAVDTWDKFGCDADSKLVPYKDCYVPYIHYDDVVKAIKGMPSIQPKTDVLDKIRAEILVLDDADYDFEGYYKAVTDALKIIDKYTEEEIWEGIHAQVTAPKGTFDKIWNEAEDNDEI